MAGVVRGSGRAVQARGGDVVLTLRDENLDEPKSARNRKKSAKSLCFMWIAFVDNCRQRCKSR